MIKLDKAVIVEGKYDKITLSNILDAVIIPTNGFEIFKDKSKKELIKKIAKEKGIIVLTDSDYAGAQIRAYLKQFCGIDNITNVYIPQLKGREKRKTHESSQGFLGVEGMNADIIEQAFKKSGLLNDTDDKTLKMPEKVTKNDFFVLGLSGQPNSKETRNSLLEYLNLPKDISSSGMLDAINALFDKESFIKEVEKWRQDKDKN